MTMNMTRRAVLAGLGTSAVSSRALGAVKGKTVAVIGAGFAGLAAAVSLKAAGAKVIVIEARNRIGGRIWTSRQWADIPIDLGASWIHGVTGNPITALADAAGAKRVGTSYDSYMSLDAHGQEGDDPLLGKAQRLVSAARAAAEKLEKDISLAAAVQRSPEWAKAAPDLRRSVRRDINGTVEQEYGGDWSEESSWNFDDGEEFSGGDVLFPGGYDQVPQYLARGLDIRLGQKVISLASAPSGVSLKMADGGVLAADHAVVTVPLGVLRAGSLRFGAALAPARQKAIEGLRMGLLNKCWLRFDRIAWPNDVDWISWDGPKDGYWAEWVSLAHAAKVPVLLGFHAGAQAREMEKLNDKAMTAAAHEALKAMFGGSFPAPIAAQITRWSQDPLALGSYSFNAVGTSKKSRAALAGLDWGGRIAFAGEATSATHYGTAHGAVLSGRAAAKAIAAL